MPARELKLDKEAFLAHHWQRKPLLIRHGIPAFTTPLPADELAGLALEYDVESRLIEHVDGEWSLHHGPFDERDFQRDNPWTLLVQAVDHYVPAVTQLRQLVDFLPQWRVDDVMVSYASDGGSVGPHYDNYDVFLLQGEGERRWQLGEFCNSDTPLLPHDDLRILRDFNCTEEYVLGPGDILYVPPGLAHWGVAQGECTTFSIGFRAPRINDMVSRWLDGLLEQLDPELYFADSHIEPVTRAGEIRPRDLERVLAQVQAALDQETDNHWFGQLVTEPRYENEPDDDALVQAQTLLHNSPTFVALSPASRVAWQQEQSGVVVFANGESRTFSTEVLSCIETLCDQRRLDGDKLNDSLADPDCKRLLHYLLETGGIYVE